MKKCYTLLKSFISKIFLFFKLHIHVEAGIRSRDNESDHHEEENIDDRKSS